MTSTTIDRFVWLEIDYTTASSHIELGIEVCGQYDDGSETMLESEQELLDAIAQDLTIVTPA